MKNKILGISAIHLCLFFILLAFCISKAKGQNPVLLECIKISKAYQASNYLSFDLKYTYAKEGRLNVLEDSSFVQYKMHGHKYQGSMDSVVFMQNDSIKVAVYLADRIITLAPALNEQEMSFPLAQLDSFFLKNNFNYAIGADAGYKKITVDYTNLSQNPLRKFEMWYDSVTYRINRLKYEIDDSGNESWGEDEVVPVGATIVEILFSNYRTGAFTNAVFNTDNYFTKSGGVYTPASPYSGYEVFVTSPGM